MQDYHQLDIWNRAMDYAVAVYKLAAALRLTRNTIWAINCERRRHR